MCRGYLPFAYIFEGVELVRKIKLDKITTAEISYKDISIWQDGSLVILDKEQILELAQIIQKGEMANV
jgi:hypothetical protein